MQPDDRMRIGHVLKEAERVARWIKGHTYDTFLADDMLHAAVTRSVEIVGEACWQLTAEFREQVPEASWKEIIGMRHRLVHAYFDIDLRIVWSVANIHLPGLVEQLQSYAPADDE